MAGNKNVIEPALIKVANMSVNINKSQIRLGLGWDKRSDGGPDFDLDAVVFLSDREGRLYNEDRIAYDGQESGASCPVIIYNDNKTGAGDDDDEVVDVDLARLPGHITRITIACALLGAEKKGQYLDQVKGLFLRLMTMPEEIEIARFDLSSNKTRTRATAAVMGEVVRQEGGNGWMFRPQTSFHEGGLNEIMQQFKSEPRPAKPWESLGRPDVLLSPLGGPKRERFTVTSLPVKTMAEQAAKAARDLALAGPDLKNRLLTALETELTAGRAEILAANDRDVNAARADGMAEHMIDRLSLNEARVAELAKAVAQVRALPDPVGEISDERIMDSGLTVRRLRIPLGLIAFICEARPGALVEAGALCIKSGNGLIVKCGKEMAQTSAALQKVFAKAIESVGLRPEAVTVLPTLGQDDLKELLTLSETIDLVIPRGGEGLIRFVSEHSRIPVLKHFRGVCHLYVDQGADLDMAQKLLVNGKTQRPSTCNSLECLLVHQDEAAAFLPMAGQALQELGVTLKAEPAALKFLPGAEAAAADDWGREFLGLTLAVKVVPDFEAALHHIERYGSNHTEVIATRDKARADRFLRDVEAGCVMVNASSRLNDGGVLGLGAEIGISTTRLHAYGPMGLRELTTTRFIVTGEGQLR